MDRRWPRIVGHRVPHPPTLSCRLVCGSGNTQIKLLQNCRLKTFAIFIVPSINSYQLCLTESILFSLILSVRVHKSWSERARSGECCGPPNYLKPLRSPLCSKRLRFGPIFQIPKRSIIFLLWEDTATVDQTVGVSWQTERDFGRMRIFFNSVLVRYSHEMWA